MSQQIGSDRLLNGRYRLIKELGHGGMATIWEAEDESLGRRVAVKLLHPQFARDPEFLERFRREARAAAGLAHPNVVGVYDVSQDPATNTPFLVLELVEGESLKDAIRRSAPFPEQTVRGVGGALAEALEYAHRRGLIHRDVKPQNVLLGHDGRPRLTDFGIAQALSDSQSNLTRTGAVMGSVHYLAPELARGRSATPASDVYGLGVVLYEMATGRLPFTGETDMAVALAHVEQPPPSPRQSNPSISPDLESVILKALAKDPAQRFQSAGDLAKVLRAPASAQPTAVIAAPRAASDASDRTRAITVPPVQPAPPRASRVAPAPPRPSPRRAVRPPDRRRGGFGVVSALLVLAVALLALGAGFFGVTWLSRGSGYLFGGTSQATPTRPAATPSPTVAATATPAAVVKPPEPTASPTPEPTDTPVPPTATPVPPTPTVPRATPTPQRVSVPSVVGRKQNEADAALRAAGLTPQIRMVNVNAEAGTVVTQAPDPGAPLPPGSTVTISVATGVVPVPDVSGRPEAQAGRMLLDQGFRVPTIRQDRNGTVPPGTALRTNPPAGTLLPRGADVDLYVATR